MEFVVDGRAIEIKAYARTGGGRALGFYVDGHYDFSELAKSAWDQSDKDSRKTFLSGFCGNCYAKKINDDNRVDGLSVLDFYFDPKAGYSPITFFQYRKR